MDLDRDGACWTRLFEHAERATCVAYVRFRLFSNLFYVVVGTVKGMEAIIP